ncbi:MAG: uridine kinase [Acidimicrobiales bacterium]
MSSLPATTLVGICGGSGSGKSTLAAAVAAGLGTDVASLLAFDTYYRDHGHLTPAERADVNYDHPDSLDVALFVKHLDALIAGQTIDVPLYDFATHTRTEQTTQLQPQRYTVVEGILLFAFPEIAKRMTLRVYRDCPERTRFQRRVRRDVAERGRTPESVAKQFDATVKPMHDKFVQPSMEHAHLIIPGDGVLQDSTARVLIAIEQLGAL